MKKQFFAIGVVGALLGNVTVSFPAISEVVDIIVASVDGKPITLQDVSKRIGKKLSLEDLSTDPEARNALDTLITNEMVVEEASQRKISVGPEEISAYIQEVAERNGLTPDTLEKALATQGKNFGDYKEEVKIEILKGRLGSQFLRGSGGVSEDEITNYLQTQASQNQEGKELKLSQILIKVDESEADGVPFKKAKETLNQVLDELDEGTKFAKVAQKYSDSPEGKEGGSLGVLKESDLSPEIFDAILSLKKGEVSKPIKTAQGIHLFRVDERFESAAPRQFSEDERENARRILERQKMETKMANFFTEELPKTHAVDKKI